MSGLPYLVVGDGSSHHDEYVPLAASGFKDFDHGHSANADEPSRERLVSFARLEKKADYLMLWALGVGAAVSGNFFGWNFGLDQGVAFACTP